MKLAAFFMAIALGLPALCVEAKPPLPYAPSATELASLPEACRLRLGPRNEQSAAATSTWVSRLGRDVWIHIHHYCQGLNFMNRAQVSANSDDRRFNLRRAVNEFDYVLGKWPQNSPMIDEAKSKKRQAELLLKVL